MVKSPGGFIPVRQIVAAGRDALRFKLIQERPLRFIYYTGYLRFHLTQRMGTASALPMTCSDETLVMSMNPFGPLKTSLSRHRYKKNRPKVHLLHRVFKVP